jgi:hypothetical protein
MELSCSKVVSLLRAGRRISACLLEDGREVARGRQADEKVCELFGVASGSGRAIDDAAFGVLWVGQGRSTVAPIIAGRADSMLSALIEDEVGTLVGGDRARTAISQLGAELARYQTDTTSKGLSRNEIIGGSARRR